MGSEKKKRGHLERPLDLVELKAAGIQPDMFKGPTQTVYAPTKIGAQLESMRKFRGLSVPGAARATGITKAQWLGIEAGQFLPSNGSGDVKRIEAALERERHSLGARVAT